MIKKRFLYDTQRSLGFSKKIFFLDILIIQSLLKNFEINYIYRYSFLIQKTNNFIKSKNLLLCFITLQKRTPNRNLFISRFYFSKNFDLICSVGYIA